MTEGAGKSTRRESRLFKSGSSTLRFFGVFASTDAA
jgi:hypothetical protein